MSMLESFEPNVSSFVSQELADSRQRSHRLAFYDEMTALPNRRSFTQMLERLAQAKGSGFGLLLLDIDHLKRTNDTKGHAAGDQVICEVAARLQALSAGDCVFRLSSDEFAIICLGCSSHFDLQSIAFDVLASMTMPGFGGGKPQVSVGGALFGADGDDGCTLRQNAGLALQQAKANHRGGYAPFDSAFRSALIRTANVVETMACALDEGRVATFYQPLVRLDTEEVVGLEALSRVIANDGAVLAAGCFQEVFSEPLLAGRLTRQMLAQVAHDLRCWIDSGLKFQHVGINLSAVDFARGDLEQLFSEAFDCKRVPLKHIVLEVTEAVFMDGLTSGIIEAIERLRQRGLLVALDDFGTGFASLTHLRTFPVDIIKIDKSFVDRLHNDLPSEVIVEALIRIGRRLDIRVVAEGIETKNQATRLQEMGCVLGQGFMFGRPADAASTSRILAARAQR